jgi:glycosyltransferase involved in cell wall biosynthesis
MPLDSVIVLNDFAYVQGGASKVAIDEAVALHAHGLDVTFLAAVGAPCAALRDAGLRVVALGQPELLDLARRPGVALQGLWNRGACTALRTLLERHDPRRTILHLHGYTKALTAAPALAARRAGFRTVCTLHDFFSACPNGAFFDYRRQTPCELHALSPRCVLRNCDKRHPAHKAYRVLRGAVQRYVARFPASVRDYIALSRRSAELLRPYLPAEAALYPLENIIDLPRRPPADVGANGALVVLGRLDMEKGVVLAAEAARSAGLPIVFAGDGPARAAVQAVGGTVTGWLDSAQVVDTLDRARCLVFPSLWYETFGLVVDEAAARGVPAIVSDIAAAAERVEHEVTGWIFRSGDREQLAARMQAVRDDGLVRSAGQAAYRRFWSSPPDRARHVRGLLEIYGAVMARDQFAEIVLAS